MTVRGYLDLLASTFMVRLLTPWAENLAKRQVKAPKVYLRDTGLLHALLGIRTADGLERHPKVGASWEGFIKSCAAGQRHLGRDHWRHDSVVQVGEGTGRQRPRVLGSELTH